ncbi:hypothetical protein [Croceibacterium ferulae]|uniref:hypothetical protein n=1 Tax=Croceibacterium ferulae TaxID=1854641 RepID=UPI000EAF2CF3|nr:hypothetical protein [Croceibacterium ferulae]
MLKITLAATVSLLALGILTVVPRTTPVSIDNSSSEWLPSANLPYDLTDDLPADAILMQAGRTGI